MEQDDHDPQPDAALPVTYESPETTTGGTGTDNNESEPESTQSRTVEIVLPRLQSFFSIKEIPLSIFFAVLMWFWFAIQIYLFPRYIAPIGSPMWDAAFVLNSVHPEYVWTWITAMFSHGSLIHLFVNTVVLMNIGYIIEKEFSRKDFLVIFFMTGLVASAVQLLRLSMADPSITMGIVGASGAISGLVGALVVRKPAIRFYLFFIIPMPAWIAVAIFIVISLAATIFVGAGAFQLAHMAHAGGAIAGIAYSVAVR